MNSAGWKMKLENNEFSWTKWSKDYAKERGIGWGSVRGAVYGLVSGDTKGKHGLAAEIKKALAAQGCVVGEKGEKKAKKCASKN